MCTSQKPSHPSPEFVLLCCLRCVVSCKRFIYLILFASLLVYGRRIQTTWSFFDVRSSQQLLCCNKSSKPRTACDPRYETSICWIHSSHWAIHDSCMKYQLRSYKYPQEAHNYDTRRWYYGKISRNQLSKLELCLPFFLVAINIATSPVFIAGPWSLTSSKMGTRRKCSALTATVSQLEEKCCFNHEKMML